MTIVPIRGLFEAHLTVSDLDRSIAFYRDVLGLPLAQRVPARQVAFFWVPSSDKAMLGLWSYRHIAAAPSAAYRVRCGVAAGVRIRCGAAAGGDYGALRRWHGDRGAGGALLDAGGERVFRRSGWAFTGVHLHAGRIAAAGAGSGIMVGVAEADMSDEVRVELRDGWRKLVLNRPDKLNAANEAMLTALLHALDAAEADHACRALLLTGEGRGFCAGQELGPAMMPGPGGAPDLGTVAALHHRLVRRLRASAAAGRVRGEWRGRGRWGELRAGVRYRAGGAQCEVHPGVREDRPCAGLLARASSCRG